MKILKKTVLTVLLLTVAFTAFSTSAFAAEPKYSGCYVSLGRSGNGSFTGNGHYWVNEVVTIEAIPDPGYAFDCWKDNKGNIFSREPKVTFTITGEVDRMAFMAYFKPSLDPELIEVSPSEINVPFQRDKEETITINSPDGYLGSKLQWSLENPEIARIYYSDKDEVVLKQLIIGSTVLHGKYEDIDIKINVTFSTDKPIMANITKDDVKNLYNKYITSDNPTSANPLYLSKNGILNQNSNITDYGRKVCLDYVNYFREVSGCPPVTWNDHYIQMAQAGVDFLAKNNLQIDHNAAHGSGDDLADSGLSGSNLYGGPDPLDSIAGYFNDIRNVSAYSVGHRDALLNPWVKQMGIASSRNSSALFVQGERRNDLSEQIVCYPAQGESPIELISAELNRFDGVPLWSINFNNVYRVGSSIDNYRVNIRDNTGKSIDFYHTNTPDKTGSWFTGSYTYLLINPYQLVDGNYQNALGKTYTITVTGLTGYGESLSYTTHICSLNDILNSVDDSPLENGNKRIFRVYNITTGEHLYTPYAEEVRALTGSGWRNEDVGWIAPQSGTPVYRLYNSAINDHLYTTDKNEFNVLTSGTGWKADNNGEPMFYASESGIPIYRLYNSTTKRHLLTKDKNEYDVLKDQGWSQEGTSFYAAE